MVNAVAMLSMHTSPLAQPGEGDSGGMNVFVRELSAALAQAGVTVRVYVRRDDPGLPDRIPVEPGFEVVHIDAGPTDLPKELLTDVVDEFADGVAADIERAGDVGVIHANYWLSGVAGHRIKHQLALPLVSTFHTLAAVKSSTGDHEPQFRIDAESAVIGCSDLITASNPVEARQLVELVGARAERIELVPPGVDHAFFSPGDQRGARFALGLDDRPVLLFVGRIQPLKGLDVAVDALIELDRPDVRLVAVGGPSGRDGAAELARITARIEAAGIGEQVRFVPPQPHHLLSTYYRAADLAIVPSRSESFGLVALEAAACGLPVVAAAVGGLNSLVDPGRTGLLIEGRDPADYSGAIRSLLDNPSERAEMSRRSFEESKRYRWSGTAGRLRRVFGDLAATSSLVSCA